jgi:uncharacterized protein YqhQ
MFYMISRAFWYAKLSIANFTIFLLNAGEDVLVGGQAVFEGVMMRSPRSYSIAVRKTDGSIVVKKDHLQPPADRKSMWGYPVIRGVAILGQAFTLGIRALKFSSDQILSSLEHRQKEGGIGGSKKSGREIPNWLMAVNILIALGFFILLFKVLPLLLTSWLKLRFTSLDNRFLFSLVDGLIRMGVFLLYIFLVSRLRDIRRMFEYHGAEHKVVFTFESHESLLISNAKKFSTLHPRCGTSFLMVVMLISTLVYAFIPFDSFLPKLLSRVILIPFIAGISYEIIRFAAFRKSPVLNLLTLPGLWLQRVTTKEPDDSQLEIAIHALKDALWLESSAPGLETA